MESLRAVTSRVSLSGIAQRNSRAACLALVRASFDLVPDLPWDSERRLRQRGRGL